jgi:hypothetical protein
MPKVELKGIKTIEVDPGRRLVVAIEDAGVDILGSMPNGEPRVYSVVITHC